MGIQKVCIAFTMLVVLGFSVASQAFGKTNHSPTCSTDLMLEGTFANCEHGSLNGAAASDSHSPEHCQDPCHLGLSHFGHCSAVFRSFSIPAITMNESTLVGANVQRVVKAPDLDGPRRPPRIS